MALEMVVTRNGGAQHKLFFSKDKIELKLRDGVDEDGEKWVIAFAEQVVREASKYAIYNVRGRIRRWKQSHIEGEDCLFLTLHYPNRNQVEGMHFCSCRMSLPKARGNA